MTHLDAPPAVQKRPESRHPDRLPQASESHPARPPKVSRTRSRRQRATCGTLAPTVHPALSAPTLEVLRFIASSCCLWPFYRR